MKKILSAAALLMAAAMSFTGCSSAAPSSGSTPASEASGNPPAANVNLTMVEAITSPARTAILRELCDKFEAANPGVTIELVSPPMENADQKLSQMLMAKQKIDVIEVRDQTFTQFSNNGWIAPLNSYLKDWEGMSTLSETAQFYMNAYSEDTYFVPYGFFQKALFYRADWFKEAGLEAPKTWQELVDTAVKFTDPSKNRYGYSFRGAQGVTGYLDMVVWGNLGMEKLASPIAGYLLGDGSKAMWSDPAAKEAIELYKRLYAEGSPKDAIAWGFPEMVQGFIGGTTAMLIQDPEVIAMCTSDMEEGTWAVAPLPTGSSGQALIPTGFAGWGITSYTEHADLAAELVKFISNEENNTYFCEKHSLIPIHTTAADQSPIFKDGPWSGYMKMATQPDVYKAVNSPSQYQAYGEFLGICDEWVQRYLQGDVTLEDMTNVFNTHWETAFKTEGKRW